MLVEKCLSKEIEMYSGPRKPQQLFFSRGAVGTAVADAQSWLTHGATSLFCASASSSVPQRLEGRRRGVWPPEEALVEAEGDGRKRLRLSGLEQEGNLP